MSNPFDRPLRFALGRTTRELALLGIGCYFTASELTSRSPEWPNFWVYLLATLVFAVRLFPARAIAVGTALGAIAQRWSGVRTCGLHGLDWTAYAPFVMLALLCARDLRERFDRAPSRRFLPNPWCTIPAREARALRWCAYALGTLAALTSLSGRSAEVGWAQAVVALLGLLVLLLALGRAAVVLAIPPITLAIAAWLLLQLRSAEALLAGAPAPDGMARIAAHSPEYVLPGLVCALAAAAIATPYAARLLLRAARA